MIHHLVMNIIILQVDLDILCHLVEFQVNLSTRIVPGALPRVIVVQEAESLHATWVIFDRFYLCLSLPPSGTCINVFFVLQCFLLTSAFCKWSMIKFLLWDQGLLYDVVELIRLTVYATNLMLQECNERKENVLLWAPEVPCVENKEWRLLHRNYPISRTNPRSSNFCRFHVISIFHILWVIQQYWS